MRFLRMLELLSPTEFINKLESIKQTLHYKRFNSKTYFSEVFKKNGKPEIFNTDQGSQFTSNKFVTMLLDKNIKVSMDSKGRALNNAYMEHIWRSLKYEDIYLNDYQSIADLRKGVNRYFIEVIAKLLF